MVCAGCRPLGRLFYWAEFFGALVTLALLLSPFGFAQSSPPTTTVAEELFAQKSGAEKKDAAMSFLQNAIGAMDAISDRTIIEPERFRRGMSMAIDGVVECLNASTWAKDGKPFGQGLGPS